MNKCDSCYSENFLLLTRQNPKVQKLTDSEILDLYAFLKHGSEDHQEWLLKALFHYFKDTPKPEYKT